MAAYGLGASLSGMGMDQQQQATKLLGTAAEQEQTREMQNKQMAQQAKAGNMQLGTTLGAAGGMYYGMQAGSVGGPWGMAIGALVGGLAAGILS